jgi:hypothetical protein
MTVFLSVVFISGRKVFFKSEIVTVSESCWSSAELGTYEVRASFSAVL